MVRLPGARASSLGPCLALALAAAPRAHAASAEPAAFAAALARGDAHYARRAEGARGDLAQPGPVETAIADYRAALALRPDSAAARYRLLRALYFRASYCGATPETRGALLDEARAVADEGMAGLENAARGRKGAERLEAWREIDDSGEFLFWSAVTWGEWALGHSRWAAARAGAPGRIRDLAQAVIDLDPALEEGGGYRLLGRLHDQSPIIPFVSGFVSRAKGLALLRRAYAAFPANSVNQVFLAQAILRHDPAHRREALELLERRSTAAPRAEYAVEDARFTALARQLLDEAHAAR